VALRPKFWPRPRSYCLGIGLSLEFLASTCLDVVLLRIRAFSCKNRVKFANFVNFSGNNLKSYVVNHYSVLFHSYFGPRP